MTMRGQPILSRPQQLEAASTALTLAWASDAIWWYYRGKETFPLYGPARDRFVDFFRFEERAHLNNFIIHLWTLFDRRKGTVSLMALIEMAAMDEGLKDALRARLAGLRKQVEKIGVLRHNLIAHRNNTMTYNEVFKAAEISHDEMRGVLEGAREVLNSLRIAEGLVEWLPNEGARDDVEDILEILREGY